MRFTGMLSMGGVYDIIDSGLEETPMSVQMELCRILISENQDCQIIELREVGGERRFPIVIGLYEAAAIERRLKGIEISRPQTHDLLSNVIEQLGGKLTRIVINDIQKHTFYSELVIETLDERVIHVDSRPSDAIALGIASEVPIYVAEHVLDDVVPKQDMDDEY